MSRPLHPNSRRALQTVMRGPHRRGGGKRSTAFRTSASLAERFRRWAIVYWPEALQ